MLKRLLSLLQLLLQIHFLETLLVTSVEHVGHGPDEEEELEFIVLFLLLFGAFLASALLFAKTALKHL